ncbi:MAG: hypothetical protein V4467_02735 [Patescibacteria group bacterium]
MQNPDEWGTIYQLYPSWCTRVGKGTLCNCPDLPHLVGICLEWFSPNKKVSIAVWQSDFGDEPLASILSLHNLGSETFGTVTRPFPHIK